MLTDQSLCSIPVKAWSIVTDPREMNSGWQKKKRVSLQMNKKEQVKLWGQLFQQRLLEKNFWR